MDSNSSAKEAHRNIYTSSMDNPSTTLGIIQWPSLTTTPSEHLLLGTDTLGATTSTMPGSSSTNYTIPLHTQHPVFLYPFLVHDPDTVVPSHNVTSTGAPKIRIHDISNAPAVDGKSKTGNSSRCSIQYQPP
nr:hypothetical protein L203_04972 [Cryptococcus depauperatus CBS 7841]